MRDDLSAKKKEALLVRAIHNQWNSDCLFLELSPDVEPLLRELDGSKSRREGVIDSIAKAFDIVEVRKDLRASIEPFLQSAEVALKAGMHVYAFDAPNELKKKLDRETLLVSFSERNRIIAKRMRDLRKVGACLHPVVIVGNAHVLEDPTAENFRSLPDAIRIAGLGRFDKIARRRRRSSIETD